MRQDRGRGFGGRSFAPVKVGDELDVKIEAVGEKGDGIAKKDGFVLFVPATKQGDNVRIKVTRVLQKVGFAEVVGEASGEPAEEGAEAPAEEAPAEETEESPEDSDDFGEEPAQEESSEEEEAPAEEDSEEDKKE